MACIVMVYMVVAYIGMAYKVMAYSYVLYSYGLWPLHRTEVRCAATCAWTLCLGMRRLSLHHVPTFQLRPVTLVFGSPPTTKTFASSRGAASNA